jgi:hypothetical protein
METSTLGSDLENYRPCRKSFCLFLEKLQEETKWSQKFAESAISEYVKFLKIIKKYGVKQTPSKVVDEVWHLHLQFTKDYWEDLCPKVLGFPLHHVPTLKNKESSERNWSQYKQTLDHYRELFGNPPTEFWGNREPKKKNSLINKYDKNHLLVAGCSLIMIFTVASPGFSFLPSMSGKDFLFLYGILLTLFNVIVFLGRKLVEIVDYKFSFIVFSIFGYFCLFVFGGLRIYHGMTHGYSVGYLFMEMIFGLFVIPQSIFGIKVFSSGNRRNSLSGSSSCSSVSSSSCGSSDGGGGGCGGCGGGD